MPKLHRFKVGDIVRVNADGRRVEVFGYTHGDMEVTEARGYYNGDPVVRLRPVSVKGLTYGSRWREKWYELVGGPW